MIECPVALLVGWLLVCAAGYALAFIWWIARTNAESGRKLALHALMKLYVGNHVGGCNNRHEGQHCNEDTPVSHLCAPCYGRRVIRGDEMREGR